MRLLVLTTQTPHHAHFVREMANIGVDLRVVQETTALAPPFDTAHAFETERDEYELRHWFNGAQAPLAAFAETLAVENVNCEEVVALSRDWGPDVAVAFGVRRVKLHVIGSLGPFPLNLHGGDPEEYRGLDTHLWAIYHGDFSGLATTLHVLAAGLDEGAVVETRALDLERDMPLAHLRRANTDKCVDLVRKALCSLSDSGLIRSRKQRQRGRYYSFMPAVLKDICQRRFESYTSSL